MLSAFTLSLAVLPFVCGQSETLADIEARAAGLKHSEDWQQNIRDAVHINASVSA